MMLSPWRPEQDLLRLAVLGKLNEELGEASAIVSRCIIQGIGESEPVTLKPNRVALENELADVLAGIHTAMESLGLDSTSIHARVRQKREHLAGWHQMIREFNA